MVLISAASTTNPFIKTPDSLYSYWKLNEFGGAAIDYMGEQDVAETGTVPSVAGKFQRARGPMSNAGNYLATADLGDTTEYDNDIFMAEGWFKTPTLGSDQMMLSKWDNTSGNKGWTCQFTAANKVALLVSGTYLATSTNTFAANKWHYAALIQRAVSGADTVRVYVNGVKEATGTGTNWTPSTKKLEIGSYNTSNLPWLGTLDDWAYHNDLSRYTSWAAIEKVIKARWNGGNGRQYSKTGSIVVN